ncbi:Protein GVQW3 [Nymphon striatum]|nr:Protein GVQW3 [Nymphon striatum]
MLLPVKCSNNSRYTIEGKQGTIKPSHFVKLEICLNSLTIKQECEVEEFKIFFARKNPEDSSVSSYSIEKIFTTSLKSSAPKRRISQIENLIDDDDSVIESAPSHKLKSSPKRKLTRQQNRDGNSRSWRLLAFVIFLSFLVYKLPVVCVNSDYQNIIPKFMHITAESKAIIFMILGKYYSVRKYFIHIAEMWCSGVSVKLIMSTKGATIKTKKLSKKFSFSLASPFDLDEKSLCEKYDLALKKPEFDYKLTKEERKKQLNAARLNDPGLKYRSQMFFGLNEVTKSIEKNLVAVVIFNQSLPKIMTKHIKPLCASRNASVLCIQSFNERFSVLLNLRSIQAISFKDESIREAQIKMWYKCFKEGRESVESNLCSGRPSTSRTPENVERVRDAINEDRRLTVRELEENLEIPRTSVSEILMEDLGMRHVAAKFVPWFPLQEQKAFRAEIAEDLLQTTNNDPHFLKQKCAADEESIFHDFIDMLKTLAPEPCDELKLLINEAQSVSTESSKPDSKSDSVKVLDTRKKKAVKKPVINWDSMYVLKKDFKNPFETENKKIDNFIDLSKFSDDCNPEVALEQNYFRSGSIQKKVEKSEDIYRKNPRNFLKDTFICRSLSPIIVSLGLYRGNSRFLIKSHSFVIVI